MESLLEADKLTKYFGRKCVLEELTFSLPRGKIIGFLGPNGAGKTTTLRILAGLLDATSGRAYLDGIPLATHASKLRTKIAFLSEDNSLPGEEIVGDYLQFRAQLKGIADAKKQVHGMMQRCDLYRHARRQRIGHLSRGFRQRVGIADALLGNPLLLLLDEPTAGLDPHQISEIRQLIRQAAPATTVLISSHVLGEIGSLCSHILILNRGRLVANGTHWDLLQQLRPPAQWMAKLRADGETHDASQLLQSLPAEIQWREKEEYEGCITLRFEMQNHALAEESLRQKLAEISGWELLEFQRQEPTLEQLFSLATEPNWKESHQ